MKNRYLAAFAEQGNLLALSAVAALSAATVTTAWGVPVLLGGLALEATYLIVAPGSTWFAARLARRRDAQARAERERLQNEILPLLRPTLQTRFARLEAERAAIARHVAADRVGMSEVLDELDYLLDRFLQFALKDEQFRVYLYRERREKLGAHRERVPEPTDRWVRETVELLQQSYDGDVAGLAAQAERENEEDTRAVLLKRVEVLARRRDFIARIGKIVGNLSQQLQLLEDTFGLIGDELLARAPQQLLGDIEEVVSQTRMMTQVLDEMAPYERMLAAL